MGPDDRRGDYRRADHDRERSEVAVLAMTDADRDRGKDNRGAEADEVPCRLSRPKP